MTLFSTPATLPMPLALSLDPTTYIWNLGWILIPIGAYFFVLGLVSGYRRWHVNPKHLNELRANRSRLRKDRDQLLLEFGLEREDIVGMEVDDEVIAAPSSRRRSSSKRSRSSRSSRSRSASSSAPSEPPEAKPGSETNSGVIRGLRTLPPTAAEKARLQQGSSADDVPPETAAPTPPADEPRSADTTEPPPPAEQLFAHLNNKSIESYEGFGPLFVDWPKKPDDLKRISGIGEELEGKLNDIGVFMLWQVAHWKDQNIRSMADELYLEETVVVAWVDEARRMIRRGL